MKVRIIQFAVAVLALIALGACNPEDNNNGRGIIGGGDSGNNNGDSDATDSTDDDGMTQDGGDTEGDTVDPDACQPETDEEMCERLGFECGTLTDVDNCDEERTIDSCGDETEVCEEFQTCGGGGTEGTCGCTKTTCEAEGVLCGEIDDTCGGTLTCDSFCVDSIDSGALHVCAVGSGNLKCWGQGRDGQLGNSATTNQRNPVDVIGLTNDVVDSGPGIDHTCAVTNAEEVYCWGNNERSQLGIGTTSSTSAANLAALSSGATEVVSGEVHSCALVSGGVQCWGGNDQAQLGDPDFQLSADVGLPNEVPDLTSGVTQLAAGRDHTCALLDTGEVRCWGRNDSGQLGNAASLLVEINQITYVGFEDGAGSELSASPVTVMDATNSGPLTNVIQISAGDHHTCAVTANDELFCWGALGGEGSCGSQYDICSSFPTEADGHEAVVYFDNGTELQIQDRLASSVAASPVRIDPGLGVTYVNSGADHVCMLVDESDDTKTNIYCLGDNRSGQLGDGTTNIWSTPQPVASDVDNQIVRAVELALGRNHSCALAANNNVKCWGSNAEGQVGNSDLQRDESYRPYDVKLNQSN